MSENRFGWDVDGELELAYRERKVLGYEMYKQAMQENKMVKLDKLKVMVVGQGRAGKT